MNVQHDRPARAERLTLIAAAVRGFFAGTSRAVAAWLMNRLFERD